VIPQYLSLLCLSILWILRWTWPFISSMLLS